MQPSITIDAESGHSAVELLRAARRFRELTLAWQKEWNALKPGRPRPVSYWDATNALKEAESELIAAALGVPVTIEGEVSESAA
jgi:hypothetical protein